jgi:hypothetical protein
MADSIDMSENPVTSESADLLETMARHRYLLRHTVRDLTDGQAALRTTASELCLGGLIKHVAAMERQWIRFITEGPSAMGPHEGDIMADWSAGFRMLEGETLAGLLADYERVAGQTAAFVVTLADLDVTQPLPEAPWFEPGARWSARRVLLHLIAETSQHAGHADILRESLDGAKTMG